MYLYMYVYIYIVSGKRRIIVLDRLNIEKLKRLDVDWECGVFRGWTWMGNVVWFVDGECVCSWMGYMGNGCVRGCRLMGNGGWTCWSNRE